MILAICGKKLNL